MNKEKAQSLLLNFQLNMNKINQLINQGTNFLIQQQRDNGSFLDFDNNNTYHSIFSTALILPCLDKIETPQIQTVKRKIVEFLLSQKSKQWSFNFWARDLEQTKSLPDNLSATFCTLSALTQYNPDLIDGSAIARILMLLTGLEEKEGGPYYSWLNLKEKTNQQIDLATNINIAHFLFLQDVTLPELNKLIDSAIESENFHSSFYPTPYLIIYSLSQFYKNKRKEIINYLLSKQNNYGQWDNPLNTALAILALFNFNLSLSKMEGSIKYLINSQIDIWQKPYPTYLSVYLQNNQSISLGSPALTTALWLKALTIFNNQRIKKISTATRNEIKKEQKMYAQIIKLAKQRFSSLEKDLEEQTRKILSKVIKADKDKQIVLLSYFFKNSLSQKGENISNKMIKQLGLANLYLWMAYTIYDDFLDEEGDPKLISTANVCLREFTSIFNKILPLESKFYSFFHQIMDTLDSANTWEATHCRTLVSGSKLYLPENIPDYDNFNKLSERSLAHALGPAAILFSLGYTENSREVKNLILFFKHYLTARQLNDDAHDWEKDLKIGQINSVVAEIFKKLEHQTVLNFEKDIAKLQRIFWFEMINDISNKVLEHVEAAKKSLKSISILTDISPLEKLLIPTENSAKKAIKKQKETVKFLEAYKGD